MKKVLHVVGRMHYGGTETLLMNLYRHIDREQLQFDFLVYYTNPGGYDNEIRQLGGNVYAVKKSLNPIIYWHRLFDFFSEHHDYDVIHAHILWLAWIYFFPASRYKIRKIAHLHLDKITGKGISFMTRKVFEKISIKKADMIFTCSKKAAVNHNFHGVKTYLLKNGIDGKRFYYDETIRKKVRKEFGLDNKKVLICVARFHAQKNHKFLIDIMEKIIQKDKDFLLLLVGEGPLEDMTKEKVEELGLGSYVRFMGVRSDVNLLLQGADAYVMPSLFEGLGIVYIESQAAGLKTFASDEAYTDEANISDLFLHRPLGDGAQVWADWILQNMEYERINREKEVKKSGFEINMIANTLQRLYLQEESIDTLFERN